MEKPKNYDALLTLPFCEVVVPQDVAFDMLTTRFQRVVSQNVDIFIPLILPETPDYDSVVAYYGRLKDEVKKVPPGGLGLSGDDIELMYGGLGSLTYEQVMDKVVEHVGKKVRDKKGNGDRNPATGGVGLILDALRLISPDVATFDDGVKVFAGSLRKNGYPLQPFHLGTMVDDVMNRRGTADFPFDFFADSQGATLLGASYVNHAIGREKLAFRQGLDITLEQLHMMATGRSMN